MESEIQLKESGISQTIGIRNWSSTDSDALAGIRIHGVESASKTVLDSLTGGGGGGVKIWSFRFVGVQEGKEILQKSVLHVHSCCFAY